MQDKNVRKTIEYNFDSFCKKVLKNEANNYYKYMKRRRKHELSLEDLSVDEVLSLSHFPEYNHIDIPIDVIETIVSVTDEDIAEAILQLPKEKREIILLYYFLGMRDKEIGKLMLLKKAITGDQVAMNVVVNNYANYIKTLATDQIFIFYLR